MKSLLVIILLLTIVFTTAYTAKIDDTQDKKISALESKITKVTKQRNGYKREFARFKKSIRRELVSIKKASMSAPVADRKPASLSEAELKELDELPGRLDTLAQKNKKLQTAIKEGWLDKSTGSKTIVKNEGQIAHYQKRYQQLKKMHEAISNSREIASSSLSNVSISGEVEFLGDRTKTYGGTVSSGFTFDKAVLGFKAKIDDAMKAKVVFKLTTGGVEADKARIDYTPAKSFPLTISTAYGAPSFGVFDGETVTDPIIKSVTDTDQSHVNISIETHGLTLNTYVYKGATQKENTNSTIKSFGGDITYALEKGDLDFNASVAYTNNLSDHKGFNSKVTDAVAMKKIIAGYRASGKFSFKGASFISEYITAASKFNSQDLEFKSKGAKPAFYQLELDYNWSMFTVALAYHGTKEAIALELPESKALVALVVAPYKNSKFAFEWGQDKDYGTSDCNGATCGTGKDATTYSIYWGVSF